MSGVRVPAPAMQQIFRPLSKFASLVRYGFTTIAKRFRSAKRTLSGLFRSADKYDTFFPAKTVHSVSAQGMASGVRQSCSRADEQTRRGALVVPDEVRRIIERSAADLTSRSLRNDGSEWEIGGACLSCPRKWNELSNVMHRTRQAGPSICCMG